MVEVHDDGRGTASAAPELERWPGLTATRERVHILGAELQAGQLTEATTVALSSLGLDGDQTFQSANVCLSAAMRSA